MVAWTKPIAVAFSFGFARAIQVSPMKAQGNRSLNRGPALIMLDASEVESRGSHCLDGSAPSYRYESGTDSGKWMFWFQGGGLCVSESDCATYLPLTDPGMPGAEMDALPLMVTGEFNNYNHVYFPNCDLGLFLGDNPNPVDYQGTKLYFQGKRIVDHVLDALASTTTFGSAAEVIISGGSGGGQTSFAIADYLAGVMPASVQKFGAAPINGWYAEGSVDEIKTIFKLANMGTAVSTACKNSFPEDEQYNCIIPTNSYTYAQTPIFLTQLFDYTYSKNETLSDLIGTQYMNCLSSGTSGCTEDDVSVLQDHLNTFTSQVQSTKQWQANGGFLSTCTEHTFYNDEDQFAGYKNNGVSAGTAIESWWASLNGGSATANSYVPCTLGSSNNVQCEATCAA